MPDADGLTSDLEPAAACFGFRIETDEPLRYLRRAATNTSLHLAVGDVEPPDEGQEPVLSMRAEVPALPPEEWPVTSRAFLRERPGHYAVQTWAGGWYDVDVPARRITMPADEPPLNREEKLWGLPSRLLLTELGMLAFHGAAVGIDGRALLFLAPSRFGKTTLTLALVRAGHTLLAEDATAVRLDESGPVVLPGPAMLRVRRDVADSTQLPGRVVDRNDDRVHLAVADDRPLAEAMPLAGVVLLRWATGDRVAADEVSAPEAMRDVFSQALWLRTGESRAAAFAAIADTVALVPVWDLHRPMRLDLIDRAVEAAELLCG